MKRSLGFWRTWALVVGTMIGSGVFLLPAVLAPYGSYSLLGWFVSGAGTLFIALVLGSLARRIPRIGGPYAYTREAFGDLPAFLVGWGYWISMWSAGSAIAVAFSGYLSSFVPVLNAVPVAGAIGAVAVLWLFTGVNIAGVRSVGIVQLITTVLKLLPLVAVAAAGLWVGNVTDIPATNPNGQSLPLMVAAMAMLTMWAYVGLEAATVPAEDIVEPGKTIPRAVVVGTLTATVVYILATMGVMALMPAADLAKSASPFTDAAVAVFGAWGAKFIAVGALIAIAGALNSIVLLSGQVPRATALDGLFPRRFEALNRRGAPTFSLVVSSILASVLIAMNYTRGLVSAFTTLILISTLTTLIPYAASAAAECRLQWLDAENTKRGRSLAIAVVALAFSLFAIIGSGVEVFLYGMALLAAGLPVYFWVKRRGSSEH